MKIESLKREIQSLLKTSLTSVNKKLPPGYDYNEYFEIMNSLRFIELIIKIEEKYEIEILNEDLTMENAKSLNTLINMLNKYLD